MGDANAGLLEDGAEAREMRRFLGVNGEAENECGPGLTVDSESILVNCSISRGTIQRSVLVGVTADVVDVSDSVVVACGAPEIRAKGALLYNVSDEGGVAANIGDVRVDAYLPPDERIVLHTRLDRNGRNDWATRLPGNAMSYAELHRRNASVDPVEAAAMAADQRAGVRHGKGKR